MRPLGLRNEEFNRWQRDDVCQGRGENGLGSLRVEGAGKELVGPMPSKRKKIKKKERKKCVKIFFALALGPLAVLLDVT